MESTGEVHTMRFAKALWILLAFLLTSSRPVAHAGEDASFEVDFSAWDAVPLFKTKSGVYQTPLSSKATILKSLDLLAELDIRDFRYEMGWGKDGTTGDEEIRRDEFDTSLPFVLDIETLAPPTCYGRRVILSFILENSGAGSRARVEISKAE
jgi:hypothetical protein